MDVLLIISSLISSQIKKSGAQNNKREQKKKERRKADFRLPREEGFPARNVYEYTPRVVVVVAGFGSYSKRLTLGNKREVIRLLLVHQTDRLFLAPGGT